MRHRLPSLNALRAFEAVGRRGSVTAGAEELGVTPGAASRHIGLLEAHFQKRLLVRHPRGVSLTASGRVFLEQLSGALDSIGRACRDFASPGAPEVLLASFYTTFATEWLAPRLDRFRQLHPNVDVRMMVSLTPVDFDNDDIDVSMIGGTLERSDIEEVPLFSTRFFPVCAPQLLERGPALRTPDDLRRHNLLYAARELELWRGWCLAAGIEPLDLRGGLKFDNLSLTYQAARGGAGVALGEAMFVRDDLESGRLVAPFKLTLDQVVFKLVYPKIRARKPAVAAFREWILDEARISNEAVRAVIADFTLLDSAPRT